MARGSYTPALLIEAIYLGDNRPRGLDKPHPPGPAQAQALPSQGRWRWWRAVLCAPTAPGGEGGGRAGRPGPAPSHRVAPGPRPRHRHSVPQSVLTDGSQHTCPRPISRCFPLGAVSGHGCY